MFPEQGTRDGGFGRFSLVAVAKLVCMPACRENERERHFFLLRFRRLIFTGCVGEGGNTSVSLSLGRHIWYVCQRVGRGNAWDLFWVSLGVQFSLSGGRGLGYILAI